MRRHWFFLIMLALTLTVIVALSGCGGQETAQGVEQNQTKEENNGSKTTEAEYVLQLGHIAPPAHSYSLGIEAFAKDLQEATDGRVSLEIFGGGQLGGERDVVEQVSLGTLDMTLVTSGPVGNFVPDLAVIEMPFLFKDIDHVYRVLDGEIGQELLAKMEDSNLVGLAFWENGFRHLSNNKHPIYSPDDLQGLTMRTIENDIFVETYRALGADPTPIAWPEVFTSIQQGVADGLDTSYGVFHSTNIYEVQKYYSETNMYYASAVLLINKDVFESLPADLQDVMRELAVEHAHKQRAVNQEMETEQKELLKEVGIEIVDFEDVDIDAFREAVQPVYERYADRFGDLVQRIQDMQ
ncbi:TRAP dicarboxylate transporter, DctP subunit [Caldalkalibacillus thermarum TA2.A1]|uniref:TRAP dicarboxylate transporter, DctP subunit n=1 Tax=Caldalkalibacillus thermarum (strain TA2.A1) TaxID=986075 RepID=F5L9I4_CALTT|nr:TRAP transporter substrate-binding protein [Caldalkalibacillus thermarum]EGL81971.1 TRAP dicarboxylate transporter, DctP subunit [Caldalkalibacillus thermarum TA2.A1]QZT34462.1 TRAP transporter substrate-binding protein [Caldalkalibacillus thermarum TA2.A1]